MTSTHLVILKGNHPLREELKEVISQLGGGSFYRLTDFSKLTTKLLEGLPSPIKLLFLPLGVTSLPINWKPLPGYPYPAWLASSPQPWLPRNIVGVISSFLPVADLKSLAGTSRVISQDITTYQQSLRTRKAHRREWKKLVTTYGADVIGPFEEFLTDRQSSTGRAASYRAYATFLSALTPIQDLNQTEDILIDGKEEQIKLISQLPPSRLARLFHRIYSVSQPKEADKFLQSVSSLEITANLELKLADLLLWELAANIIRNGNDDGAFWLHRYLPGRIPNLVMEGREDLANRLLTTNQFIAIPNLTPPKMMRPIDDPNIVGFILTESFWLLKGRMWMNLEKAFLIGTWMVKTLPWRQYLDPGNRFPDVFEYLQRLEKLSNQNK